MAGITSYPLTPGTGFAGQIADECPVRYIRSARNKEAVALPFGLAFKRGAADGEVLLPTAGTDKIVGIGVHRHDVNTIGSSAWAATAGIPVDDRFDLLSEGVVYVVVEEAVVENDPCFVRYATGSGGSQKGAFRKSADTATAVQVKGARFLASGALGAIVPVQFSALTAITT